MGEEEEDTVLTEKQNWTSSMNIEKASIYVGTVDEAVEAAAVVEAEVIA